MRFKLLRGIHTQREQVKGEHCLNCIATDNKGKSKGTGKVKNVFKGDGVFECPDCYGSGVLHEVAEFDAKDPKRNIVETTKDLEALHGSEKFQNLEKLGVAGSQETQD